MKLLVLCLLFGAVLALTRADPSEDKPKNEKVADPESVDETEQTDETEGTELSEEVADPESVDETEQTDETEETELSEETEETELSEAEDEDGAGRAKRCVCRARRWCKYSGRRYVYFPYRYHWSQAQRYCLRFGASLASIHNSRDNHFLRLLAQKRLAWIGLFDAANERYWLWVNSGRYNYANWCRGQPNNYRRSEHCVFINWSSKKCWNDYRCSVRLPFICMKK